MGEHATAHADHGGGGFHVTRKDYVTGFLLAGALTAIPFWLVMTHAVTNPTVLGLVVMILAAVQVVVHMIYFLHMNSKSEQGWTLLALLFTGLLLGIVLSGSMWVMHHLQTNMMPVSAEQMRQAP